MFWHSVRLVRAGRLIAEVQRRVGWISLSGCWNSSTHYPAASALSNALPWPTRTHYTHTECRFDLTASHTDLAMIVKDAARFWKDSVSRWCVKSSIMLTSCRKAVLIIHLEWLYLSKGGHVQPWMLFFSFMPMMWNYSLLCYQRGNRVRV